MPNPAPSPDCAPPTRLSRSQIHDLRAPLQALALNLELLRRSLVEEEDKDEAVREEQVGVTEDVAREIRRLGRLLERAREHAARGAGTPTALRPLDVRRPVRDTARLVQALARSSGVDVATDLPHSPVLVHAQADALRRVLLNLVLNALEAQETQVEGGAVRLRVALDGNHVRILVEDDGPGIPGEQLGRVFEMDFTTKAGGAGMGLSVARSVVESQGGRLLLESSVEAGTTVELRFPSAEEQPAS